MLFVLRVLSVAASACLLLGCDACGPDPATDAARDSGDGFDSNIGMGDSGMGCPSCLSIRNVRVFDANGVRDNQHVVLGGGRILSIDPDDGSPTVGAEIDGSGATLIPGLWDSHVHMAVQGIPEQATQVGNLAPENLRGTLYSGVTTVVDLGTIPEMFVSARSRIAAGELWLPRVKGVGPALTVPGGHPCTMFYSREICIMIEGVGSIPPLVAGITGWAPEAVKLVIEGGIPSIPLPRVTPAEILAVSNEVMATGLPLFAHVSSEADAADAVAAGVDAIAHLPIEDVLDPTLVSDYSTAGTYVVSTLSFTDAWHRFADTPEWLDEPLVVGATPPMTYASLTDPGLHPTIAGMTTFIDTVRTYTDMAVMNLQAFHAAGVPILAGSDAGNPFVLHGVAMHRELELLVAAGMTTTEALTAATLTPAGFFDEDDEYGLVEVGYVADLVLVNGDPSVDITATAAIREVILGGEPVDRAALEASMNIQNVILSPRALGESEFCVGDMECGPGLACSNAFRICRETCTPGGAPTCPAGYGCVPVTGIGLCVPGDGCDVMAQDCPYQAEYGLMCMVLTGATFCL